MTSLIPQIPQLPQTERVVDHLIALASVDSTNTLACQMIHNGEIASYNDTELPLIALIADQQTSCHGRLGRTWYNEPGQSLLISFVTVLPASVVKDPSVNGWLTIIAGLASCDALNAMIEQSGAGFIDVLEQKEQISIKQDTARASDSNEKFLLKWPNDIFCYDHKLGGILSQMVMLPAPTGRVTGSQEDTPHIAVIFGIGINLDIPANKLPTPLSTSLQLHVTRLPSVPVMRDMISASIAQSLRTRLQRFAADPSGQAVLLHEQTNRVCWTLGRQVCAHFVNGMEQSGRACSLNADASLTIEDTQGKRHIIRTGDVGVLQ